jgi:glycosyltransferase involved in cell wall biosynthesis
VRICYVLLSPTFGKHQYTADLANRMVQFGHDVHLVTTARYPGHRYLPAITVHTPVDTRSSGLSPDTLRPAAMRTTAQVIQDIQPDVVHMTGPHLWNIPLLRTMRHAGIPAVHTLHDLDPHGGMLYGLLLHAWNRGMLRLADHILVHGVRYRERLLDMGMPAERLTCTPLLHLFLGHTWLGKVEHLARVVRYDPSVLFFGRLERYKGVDHLLTAWAMMDKSGGENARLILAGPGDLEHLWPGPLPSRVEVHNHFIEDVQALEFFRHCGLLALPYMGATQSALIPAAYFFRKPVIATPSGEHPPSWSRCLSAMLSDVDRLAQMGGAGRAWYDARRDAEEKELRRMYESVSGDAG